MGVSRVFVALLALVAITFAQESPVQTENVNLAFIQNDPDVSNPDNQACTVVINDDVTTTEAEVTGALPKAVFKAISNIASVS